MGLNHLTKSAQSCKGPPSQNPSCSWLLWSPQKWEVLDWVEGAFHILHETPAFASLEASFLGSDVKRNGAWQATRSRWGEACYFVQKCFRVMYDDPVNVHIILHQFLANFPCSFWGVDVPNLFRPCRRISRRFPLLHGWKCEGPASSWQRPATFSAFVKVDFSRYNVDPATIIHPGFFSFGGQTKTAVLQ